jgi:hypothetical protein
LGEGRLAVAHAARTPMSECCSRRCRSRWGTTFRAFAAWVEVDCRGAFRDAGVAVVADDVEVISFGFARELSEHDAGSEGADVAKGGHGIVVRH